MDHLGRDFQESFKRLIEQNQFSTKTRIIIIIIIFFLDLCFIILLAPLNYTSSFILIIFNVLLFGVFILQPSVIRSEAKSRFKETISTISQIIMLLKYLKIFHNKNEEEIFRKNFESFYIFKLSQNYKYCMIAMGSMLEFVLLRYCEDHHISPDPLIRDDGKPQPGNRFSNYIQTAINRDLFGQKKRWIILQNSLRNFRNYVHISKEIKEEEIDSSWFIAMVPIFVKLLVSFGQND